MQFCQGVEIMNLKILSENDIKTVKYYTKDDKIPCSSLAYKTLVILSRLHGGLHNLPFGILDKFSYNESFCIQYFYKGSLPTTDPNHLSVLVFMAHLLAIRVEIQSTKKNGIKILFHERSHNKKNENLMYHPDLETASKGWKD